MKVSIKDIMSVIKNDGRFQGNQKMLQAINIAISDAEKLVDKKDLVRLAEKAKSLIS